MNKELIKDLGNMSYADLSIEQVSKLKNIEDEINANREDKVYIMALLKDK